MIQIEDLRKRFIYDQETGIVSSLNGKPSGTPRKIGRTSYIQCRSMGKNLLAHRIAWAIAFGEWPTGQIDHIDGNGLNNKLSNLRCVTAGENQRNQKKHLRNTSGVTGVHWDKQNKKWYAAIWANGKQTNPGRFNELDRAVAARKKAEVLHGYSETHGR